ncbi:MAG TPA: hypothetical protein VG734_10455 [Lacunisphaera sp.]|nr:hypothetical protein [Lacunisphaera sp.]
MKPRDRRPGLLAQLRTAVAVRRLRGGGEEPIQEYARNTADLQKIPLFNPRFRNVYGWPGTAAILVVAAGVFGLGVRWLAPWNPGYLPAEKRDIWVGVAVMPFAGLLVGSYLVEFLLKSGHVAFWAVRRSVVLNGRAKAAGSVAVSLLVVGSILANAGQELDAYGYLALGLSAPTAYWFITFSWAATEEKRRSSQPTKPASGLAPNRGH